MWCYDGPTSPSRRRAVLGAAVLLAGCRLEPLYGRGDSPEALPRAVDLTVGTGRRGDVFRRAMARRLRLTPDARHALSVELTIVERGLAITRAGDVTRYNLYGSARYVLTDRTGALPPVEETVQAVVGYSALLSPFATRVAQEDAEERVLVSLADRVFSRIATRSAA